MKKIVTVLLISILVFTGCTSKTSTVAKEDVEALYAAIVELVSTDAYLFDFSMLMENKDYDKKDSTDFESSKMTMKMGIKNIGKDDVQSVFQMNLGEESNPMMALYTVGNKSYIDMFGQKIVQDLNEEESPVNMIQNMMEPYQESLPDSLSDQHIDQLIKSLELESNGPRQSFKLKNNSELKNKIQEAFNKTQNDELSNLIGITEDNTELKEVVIEIEGDEIKSIHLEFVAQVLGKNVVYSATLEVVSYGDNVDLQLPSFDDYVSISDLN